MIALRTKNLSPLFSDLLGLGKFLKKKPGISLVTSPADGRDWELSGAIPPGTIIFSLIPHAKDSDETIKSHILALGVPNVIPLFKAGCSYQDILGGYPEIGIYDVEEIEEIEEFTRETTITPDYVRIRINPLKYPKEILDYCRKNKIKIIGGEIFGEEILQAYYSKMFPESFLQAFGEHNTDILEVPGNDPYLISRVYSRQGENQGNPKILEYSKSVDKSPKFSSPGLKIHQVLTREIPGFGKFSIPGGDMGEFSITLPPEIIELGDPLWEDTLIPDDVDKTDKNFLGTLHRYHILQKIQELHPPKIWKPVFTKILPDFWVIKILPHGPFKWLWKEHLYYLISGKLWKIPLPGLKNLITE